jgi:phosphoenolpyruvate carboxykinase (GTP)
MKSDQQTQEKVPGPDLIQELEGIHGDGDIRALFRSVMDDTHFGRIERMENREVRRKIASAIVICRPSSVYVNTGSPEDKAFICSLALEKGEERALAMPGHTLHFDLREEQGRIVDRTFYIADPWEYISSLAKRMDRDRAYGEIQANMGGIMEGRCMIVGFYNRGPVGAPAANPAMEITSSAYVAHSAEILYRNTFHDFEREVRARGHFFTNIHSEGLNRPEDLPSARVFMDRRYRTTYSYKCTYAGNTLLLKKGNHRFAVDKAVYGNRGRELSEHMFITGINGPGGRVTWCAGAAPSGCGKTTTALAGNHFIGDDLAQMWIAEDGGIRSINPECGIFGIVEDVNREGDPLLMDRLRNPGTEVIWSNVLVDNLGVPHWVGNGEEPPDEGLNFQGRWRRGMADESGLPVPMSHPNSRCTLCSSALGNYSAEAENPAGVETRVFTYSGRDSDTMPPVWVARDSDHGVVIGACIVSAATATEVGVSGVKRAPWANAPFIPGALGDYMDAQFRFFGSRAVSPDKKPVMAGLNYFLTHEARGGSSRKLLGEKRDVKVWLAWLERYTHGEVGCIETPMGNLPEYGDLARLFQEIIDKPYPEDLYVKQFSLYLDNIIRRIDLQAEAYGREEGIPVRLFEILDEQKKGLLALKGTFGSVVMPGDLKKS